MKLRFAIAALAALFAGPCLAAGTINLSLSQQFDTQGRPLSGCKLYFYAAGTSTPQNAYQDVALTLLWPNPMTCDSSGRIQQFFLADLSDVGTFPTATQYIKIRLTDRLGNTILAVDNLLIIGPSGGGAGGVSVDATTVITTGDVKVKYGTGVVDGFVRANGRTIGSGTSGATERANSDAQALFEYLWTADANLSVSTGRGASANADWLANKTIALPDARGRTIAALDDMGNSSAARLNTLASTTLGTAGGGQTVALGTTNLPAISHTPAGSVGVNLADATHTHTVSDPGHAHGVVDPSHFHGVTPSGVIGGTGTGGSAGGGSGVTGGPQVIEVAAATTGISISDHTTGINVISATSGISVSSATFTGTPANLGGSATAFSVLQPTILMTLYIKL